MQVRPADSHLAHAQKFQLMEAQARNVGPAVAGHLYERARGRGLDCRQLSGQLAAAWHMLTPAILAHKGSCQAFLWQQCAG